MTISVRSRFEIFKRDSFTCHYCGQSSPSVVLEVDHIVARSQGGNDDVMNLITSCWACNRGKSDKPLAECLAAEDPHERAVLLLERERQLREYNAVLTIVRTRVVADFKSLKRYWQKHAGVCGLTPADATWLEHALEQYPKATIQRVMDAAIRGRKTLGFAWVNAVLKSQTARTEIQKAVATGGR